MWRRSMYFVLPTMIALVCAGAVGAAPASAPQMHMNGQMRGMMGRGADAAPAEAPAALGNYGCTACHSVDEGGVGPAFAWVAWRYPGRGPRAVSRVAAFIEHGGQGRWGDTTMPDLNVAPADADALARWILSLPPKAPPGPASGSR